MLERGRGQEMKGEGAPRSERKDERNVKEREKERERQRKKRQKKKEGGVRRGWVSPDRAFALL